MYLVASSGEITTAVPPELYTEIQGTTDSEHVFALVLDHLSRETEGSSSWSSGAAEVLPDRTLRVTHAERYGDDLKQKGTYFVIVTSPVYGQKKVEYQPAETEELTVRFGEAAKLEVVLTGYVGTTLVGRILVNLVPRDRDAHYSHFDEEKIPDPGGRVELDPVPPGEYHLRVLVRRGRWSMDPIVVRPLTLKPGPNRETVALPALHSLVVLVPESRSDWRFDIARNSGDDRWLGIRVRKPEGGRLEYDLLTAGDYRITAHGGEGTKPERMLVMLPDDTQVRFAAQAFTALRVTIEDPAGNLSRAGLRSGDLVVAVDGKELEGEEQIGAVLALARTKESVALVVLRDGRQIEIAADVRQHGAGGSLDPAPR